MRTARHPPTSVLVLLVLISIPLQHSSPWQNMDSLDDLFMVCLSHRNVSSERAGAFPLSMALSLEPRTAPGTLRVLPKHSLNE